MDLSAARQTFIEEAHEQLEKLEEILLQIEKGEQSDDEGVNAMFRAAHTIKGSAGVFGFHAIVAFTHVVESVLDLVRKGRLAVGGELVTLLLSCGDHIRTRVDCVAAGQDVDADTAATGDTLLASLWSCLGSRADGPEAVQSPAPVAAPNVAKTGGGAAGSDNWHISLRFGRDALRNGMDPLSFLRHLGTLGTLVHVATLPDALPRAEEMDPECCYLGYEIDLRSTADKQTIESAFEFVQDDCRIRILPPNSRIDDYLRLIEDLPEDSRRVGEILVAGGTLTRREVNEALAIQARESAAESGGGKRRLGQILVNEGVVRPPVVAAALEKQRQIEEKRAAEHRFVKVQADKLDQLITLVGEMVTAGARAKLMASRSHNAELVGQTSVLSRLAAEIRDSARQLRMVQIGEVFNRFPRVVRDVSRDLGKDIELIVEGAETELDKSMVEKIGDPLMHLVRNAIDHGIEPAAVRQSRGKSARGTVRLEARRDSGSIVFEVTDDGGGLERARILAEAVETGLVAEGAELADQDVLAVIMEPGFSTADTVTRLSGRGVGMDVVRRSIESMRGTVELESVEGEGTTVRIRLPLTLAIVEGEAAGGLRPGSPGR